MSTIIGQKIRDLRKKENLSQQKLADLIGVSKNAIHKWETGETTPNTSTLQKLTDHPQFSQYSPWLLGYENTASEPPVHYVAEKFDKLPPAKQRALLEYMDFLLAQQEKDKT